MISTIAESKPTPKAASATRARLVVNGFDLTFFLKK